MYFNVCDANMQDQGRIQNLVQENFLEGVVSTTTLGNTLVEFQLLCLS